ncbi:MAG: dTDP-4-dehydrorhamnose 3,5-epimerase [Tistlia sp.]|uniref:dTDP-4-dehydrorhamnose 3,5-epimerase n=1 Tax=Tistlia sp. TaxID=3057121 RepID=UPI0034A3B4DA
MNVSQTALPGVLLVEPQVFRDGRGAFMESWNARRYAEAGIDLPFVQDNVSRSAKGVLRGLHLQHPRAQGKLVQVLLGEVFDVAVDLRPDSPSFRKWVAVLLSADNARQLWIPPGFHHGFCVTSEEALFAYKCTDFYAPGAEAGVAWDDPEIGIEWPTAEPTVSQKDAALPRLAALPDGYLPPLEAYPVSRGAE